MKELEVMAERLQEALGGKEKELLAAGHLSITAQSLLQNRAIEISSFEAGIKDVSSDPTLRKTIIVNCTKTANEIEDRIKSIK